MILNVDGSVVINGTTIQPTTGNIVTLANTDLDQLKADFDELLLEFGLLKTEVEEGYVSP